MRRRNGVQGMAWLVPVALLAACGGSPDEASRPEATITAEAALSPPPADYQLTLTEQPITSALTTEVNRGNTRCYYACSGGLWRYDFPWSYSGEASLEKAVEAVRAKRGYSVSFYPAVSTLTYAGFKSSMYWSFASTSLHSLILSTYGNGTENVQVKFLQNVSYEGGGTWYDDVFVILFPQSHKVLVFEQLY